jgi:hypothetical protein
MEGIDLMPPNGLTSGARELFRLPGTEVQRHNAYIFIIG